MLLNSLFKVLFNVPSRYLFAIGLAMVFSLRWSLPPTLGCILKQPDSGDRLRASIRQPYGADTLYGKDQRSRGFGPPSARALPVPYATVPTAHTDGGFSAGLFPLHSPLLRESLLVSFPPLIDMLKFRGYSRLTSGLESGAHLGRKHFERSIPTHTKRNGKQPT